jgi:hypothetical protein
MASIVLGLGTSHSPQVSIPWTKWKLLWQKDECDPRLDYAALLQRAKPNLDQALTPDRWEQQGEAAQRALAKLGEVVRQANPDAIVVFGDDQHEQFQDDNLPALGIYHGKSLPVRVHHGGIFARGGVWAEVAAAEVAGWADTQPEYPAGWELAEHLIAALTTDEFDVARSNSVRGEGGAGHAFSFVYRRIWPGGTVPIVPVMLNTYFPPNQPTPRRCYALGQAVRRAAESWDHDARIAVMASGGLSHIMVDEELDAVVLDALRTDDADRLAALPREKLRGGTSEILNWVALAGAMRPLKMTLVDYLPTYRSPAGTGCGMGFAYWN